MLDPLTLDDALQSLGAVLRARSLAFEIVAVGGSSLLLLGITSRTTRDLDVVALVQDGKYVPGEPLPAELAEAVLDVGNALGLGPEWLNAGPAQLLDHGLPDGFPERVERRAYGTLVLHVASRFDQIHLKLYAAVDQGPRSKHAADLRELAPTRDELLAAAGWTRQHDPSEPFRDELLKALHYFGVADADDLL
jgi:hypothetical protein